MKSITELPIIPCIELRANIIKIRNPGHDDVYK